MRCVARETDIVAVVTQPDRPAGRGHRLTPSAVKSAAIEQGLAVLTPLRLKAFAAQLDALRPDILVVASYGRILPQAVLDVPRSGLAFNIHPSLLPLYRGATPLQSAIRDGRTETGVTIIAMDAGMDTGDILIQERTPLGACETYGEVHDRLALRGADLVAQAIRQLTEGTLQRKPQSLSQVGANDVEATLTCPLGKDDMVLDWSWPAGRIVDTVRSLAPAPAARAALDGETVKILAARRAREGETGLTADDGFVEKAGDGRGVVVLRLTPPNRGSLSGSDYWRGRAAV